MWQPVALTLLGLGAAAAVRLGPAAGGGVGAIQDALGSPHARAAHAAAPRAKMEPEKKPVHGHRSRGWVGPLWFFGAHHKAGTNLLASLAEIQASSLGMMLCSGTCGVNSNFGKPCELGLASVKERTAFFCNTGVDSLEKARSIAGDKLRAVQIIRDPVAMVVSGYVYDMHQDDGFHASRNMRRMSTATGVVVEADFAVKNVLPGMLRVYENGRAHGDVLVLRMEDFLESSSSFDATVFRLYNHTLGGLYDEKLIERVCQLATKEDIHRYSKPDGNSAISPINLKAHAALALESLPVDLLDRLNEFRRAFGYAVI